ncbi:MAG: class I SAM-dependent methyltransferase [Patescibacteria group bacterium]
MTQQTLSSKQEKQEKAYATPYHWLIDPATEKGRLYFGYINFCSAFAKDVSGPILDAGCGDGRLLGVLRETTKNTKLYGVDYSESALRFARAFVPGATFSADDLAHLLYSNDFFDQIYLIETLEHIPPEHIETLVRELKRVLRKGGTLVVTVPSSLMGEPSAESKHYQHFTPESLRGALGNEFHIEKMHGQNKDGFHPLKIFYRLIDNPWFEIKPLRRFYNTRVWPRYFNICEPERGRRLIAICTKTS